MALGNDLWFEEMEGAQAMFFPPGISDHSSVIVYWGEEKRGLCADERRLALEFRKIKYNQFLFNKQRTNAQWIKEGDANTKFFHSLLKSRRSRNSINHITLQDGSVSTDSGIIKHEFSVYFKELLGQARECSPVDSVVVAQGHVVSGEQCRSLVRGATDKEIWSVLNNMGDDKAPGPDGFSASFFKRN
ncbi:hypothetical protein QQ045_010196 [Rhodiola kirilowii]